MFSSVIDAACFDSLSQLGPWGRLLGFCIALVYFACFESRIGGGQTVGKRWLKLRVVDRNGYAVSFGRAIVRYAIFAIPLFLNQIDIPTTRTPLILSFLISLVVFGVGGSTLYLMVFNRSTRQGLHDLAVGAYVTKADDTGQMEVKPIPRAHWAAVGLVFALTTAAWTFSNMLEKRAPFHQMRQDAFFIEQMDGVQRARVLDTLSHSGTGGEAKKVLLVSVILTKKTANEEAFADNAARILLQKDRNAQEYDELSVRIFRGYDMGIGTRWNHEEFAHTPVEWRQRVLGASPGQTPSSTHQ